MTELRTAIEASIKNSSQTETIRIYTENGQIQEKLPSRNILQG
jgi:antitoxin component YwqK of YwqJK toxin-antitoxin module